MNILNLTPRRALGTVYWRFVKGISVDNFGSVYGNLHRSALPKSEDIPRLGKFGIRGMIDLCGENPHEAELAKAAGMDFMAKPFSAVKLPPPAFFKEIFGFMDVNEAVKFKILVHCLYGADRTGLVVSMRRLMKKQCGIDKCISDLFPWGFNKHVAPNAIPYLGELHRLIACGKDPFASASQPIFQRFSRADV